MAIWRLCLNCSKIKIELQHIKTDIKNF